MTQNKFWLVWNEAGNAPKKKHDTKESAYKEAYKLSSLYPKYEFVVLSAVRSFKANVSVIENDFVELAEPQGEMPRFKVGDIFLQGGIKYEIHEIILPSDAEYPCGFKQIAYKYKNLDTGNYGVIAESEINLYREFYEQSKFKVGDKVLLDNVFECIVDDYIQETKSYKLGIMGGGYTIANEVRVTKK